MNAACNTEDHAAYASDLDGGSGGGSPPSTELILTALEEKSHALQRQSIKMFELAHHYYVQNGRGAIVVNYRNVDELFLSNLQMIMKYMPLEIAAEIDEVETVKLIVTYDPRCEFVLFLCVEVFWNGLTTNMYLHVSVHKTDSSPTSTVSLRPIRIKRKPS